MFRVVAADPNSILVVISEEYVLLPRIVEPVNEVVKAELGEFS